VDAEPAPIHADPHQHGGRARRGVRGPSSCGRGYLETSIDWSGRPSFQTTVLSPADPVCSGCHTSSSSTAQQPYFASSNINEAYAAAQQKINLASPNQSRFYVRLADEFHHCWATSSGGAPDCPGSSATMLAAITASPTASR